MRGALMAAAIDARIRETSGGRKRFRDVMRYLVSWTERNGRAFRIDELTGIFREATGVDVCDAFEAWLGPLPAE